MTPSLDAAVDPKHYIRMFWRRKGVILLATVTVICTAAVALEFVPEEYESEVTLMIEERQRLARPIEDMMSGMRQPARGYRVEEERLAELAGRVTSRPFLERVVKLLHMDENPMVLAQAEQTLAQNPGVTLEEMATRLVVRRLRSKLDFDSQSGGIYRIIVTDTDPQNAQLLAKWISELFVDVSVQTSIEQLKMAHDFGDEQVKIYEEQLRAAELALEQYKQSQIRQDLSRGVVRADNATLAESLYQQVLDEAELARLRVLPFQRGVSEAGLTTERDAVLVDPQILSQARGLASTLEEELTARLLSERRGADQWPPTGTYVSLRRGLFQLIERRIAALYPDLASANRDVLGRCVFSRLDSDAHAEVSGFLGLSISEYKRQAQSEPRGELELARLEQTVENNRDLLASFRAQQVAAEINQAVEMTNLGLRIEILDPPQVPLAPSRPDRIKILLAAIFMGPLLGAGVAFATEMMDSTLRSMADFERAFDGPVLGTTPLLSGMSVNTGRIRRYWLPAALTGVLVVTMLFLLTTRVLRPSVTASEPTQVENARVQGNP